MICRLLRSLAGGDVSRPFYVYIMSNSHRTALYTGVTRGLQGRVWQHRMGQGGRFTERSTAAHAWSTMRSSRIRTMLSRERNRSRRDPAPRRSG
ncbi:MAG: GIY-YIG nuclease family protein [Gemmatimonadota bacterium]